MNASILSVVLNIQRENRYHSFYQLLNNNCYYSQLFYYDQTLYNPAMSQAESQEVAIFGGEKELGDCRTVSSLGAKML